MRSRKSLSRKSSKKIFRKGANRIHKKNKITANPMRGGIRL